MQRYIYFAVLLVLGFIFRGYGHFSSYQKAASNSVVTTSDDSSIHDAVARENLRLPRVFNSSVKLQRIEYVDHTVHYHGDLLGHRYITAEDVENTKTNISKLYCGSAMNAFPKSGVAVEYDMRYVSQSMEVSDYVFRFTPDMCG